VEKGKIKNQGLVGSAHAGQFHHQIIKSFIFYILILAFLSKVNNLKKYN